MRFGLVLSVVALGAGLTGCPAAKGPRDGGAASDAGVVQSPPVLTSAQAQVAGRTGRDLRISVVGSDADLNVVRLWVRLQSSSGAPVLGFDSNRSSEGPVSLDQATADGSSLTAVGSARGLLGPQSQVAQVTVALQDASNLRSAELTVPVASQPVRAAGASCDPAYVADRCPPGMGCRGQPATCQEGLAPQITRLAFLKTADGPTTLIEGTEPEDDLAKLHFEFRNLQGQSILIDSDGNGTPDLAFVDSDATGLAADGVFFFRMQSAPGFDLQVPKLAAAASDVAGHQGATVTAVPSTVPVRGSGQACDPRGFDVCAASLTCAPGVVGQANVCRPASSQRTAHCQAAAVLTPTGAGAIALGQTGGQSLWDAPDGCSTNDPAGRPEGVVVLRLDQPAATLTLSTEGPGTNFDTVLYLLSGCPDTSAGALGCADDVAPGTGTSRLVLHSVAAGTYLVVVDSFNYAGGTFQLKATVE